MKTFLAGLLALLVVLAAAAWWYLRHPQAVSAAVYLPPDTLFYAEIPDGTRTFLRFQTSKLKRIVDHEETQGLLGLVFARLRPAAANIDPAAAAHLRAAGEEGLRALGGESFLAVTRFDWDARKDPGALALRDLGLIAGFHRSPDQGAHVEAFWRELLASWKDAPDVTTAGNGTHGAIPYTYLELKEGGVRVCRAQWKEWSLVSVGEASLFDFLDRASAASGPAPSLQTAPDYAAVTGKLDPVSDVLFYTDLHRALAAYRKIVTLALSGGIDDGAALDGVFGQLRFMHASAGSVAFRDGELVDRCVVAAPRAERGPLGSHFAPVALASARFTTPATVLYLAQNLDPEVYYNQQVDLRKSMQAAAPAGAPPLPDPYATAEAQVKAQGLDLHENVLRALGPELAVVVDWPQGQDIPDVLLAWAVRDREKFAPAYDKLVQTLSPLLPMVGVVETLAVGDSKGLIFTPRQFPLVSPTIFAGPEFFGLSLTGAGAKRLLAADHPRLAPDQINGPLPSLPGGARSGKPYAVAYVDLASLVGRGYAAGRPFLPKYLSSFSPGADGKSLPAASQAAPLLGTLRFAAWSEGDFLRSDLVSPEGAWPLGAVVVGGGFGAIRQRGAPPEAVSAEKSVPAPAAVP